MCVLRWITSSRHEKKAYEQEAISGKDPQSGRSVEEQKTDLNVVLGNFGFRNHVVKKTTNTVDLKILCHTNR